MGKPGETRGRQAAPRAELDSATTDMVLTLRERILAEADPVGFLIRAMNGEAFESMGADGELIREVHPLAARTEIAMKLTGKILPDLKALELAGSVSQGAEIGNGAAYERIASKLGRFASLVPEDGTTH